MGYRNIEVEIRIIKMEHDSQWAMPIGGGDFQGPHGRPKVQCLQHVRRPFAVSSEELAG